MCKAAATLFLDGQEIGRLRNGESAEFRTTEGQHRFECKALSAISGDKLYDLHDGDTVEIKMAMIGWVVELRRRS